MVGPGHFLILWVVVIAFAACILQAKKERSFIRSSEKFPVCSVLVFSQKRLNKNKLAIIHTIVCVLSEWKSQSSKKKYI